MKCLNCRKKVISGLLFGLMGEIFTAFGINPESGDRVPLQWREIKKLVVFCNIECKEEFFLHKRWFDKREISLRSRIRTLDNVRSELESAFLRSDRDEEKDLIDFLRLDL